MYVSEKSGGAKKDFQQILLEFLDMYMCIIIVTLMPTLHSIKLLNWDGT